VEQQQIIAVDSEAGAVSADMRMLYSQFKSGDVKREDADTLANIAGKNLKALSIILAHKMLENESASVFARAIALEQPEKRLKRKAAR